MPDDPKPAAPAAPPKPAEAAPTPQPEPVQQAQRHPQEAEAAAPPPKAAPAPPPKLTAADKKPHERSARENAARRFEMLHAKQKAAAATRQAAPIPVMAAPAPSRIGIIGESARIIDRRAGR